MSAKTDNADTTTEDDTTLDEPFIAEASGPVQRREHVGETITETTEITVEIQREIASAEDIEYYHALHESGDQVANALNHLLDGHDEYRITNDNLEDWEVCIDGPVAAYRAAADASFATYQHNDYHRVYTRLTRECADCHLFGVGARVAELDARRAADGQIDANLRKFAEERGL